MHDSSGVGQRQAQVLAGGDLDRVGGQAEERRRCPAATVTRTSDGIDDSAVAAPGGAVGGRRVAAAAPTSMVSTGGSDSRSRSITRMTAPWAVPAGRVDGVGRRRRWRPDGPSSTPHEVAALGDAGEQLADEAARRRGRARRRRRTPASGRRGPGRRCPGPGCADSGVSVEELGAGDGEWWRRRPRTPRSESVTIGGGVAAGDGQVERRDRRAASSVAAGRLVAPSPALARSAESPRRRRRRAARAPTACDVAAGRAVDVRLAQADGEALAEQDSSRCGAVGRRGPVGPARPRPAAPACGGEGGHGRRRRRAVRAEAAATARRDSSTRGFDARTVRS